MSLEAAYPDPYADPTITRQNPPSASITPTPPYRTTNAPDLFYDAEGTQKSGFSHTDPPPTPNPTYVGADPYKNNGMVGQTYLNNQG